MASVAATPPRRGLEQICLELQDKVEGFLREDAATDLLRGVQAQVRVAMGVIEEAMDRYEPEQISLSYNGGKDCLVLLVLILACMPRRFGTSPRSQAQEPSQPNGTLSGATAKPEKKAFPSTLQSVYVVSEHPFAEVDDFVEKSCQEYYLDMKRYSLKMRPALAAYLADRPVVKAIFVGTRRTDPHGALLKHFDPTDPGWPDFMRIHPVIDWHYVQIWAFIRHLGIEYCNLYDQGYTSLGGTTDTHPNPQLGSSSGGFRPAYELTDDYEERLGRES